MERSVLVIFEKFVRETRAGHLKVNLLWVVSMQVFQSKDTEISVMSASKNCPRSFILIRTNYTGF